MNFLNRSLLTISLTYWFSGLFLIFRALMKSNIKPSSSIWGLMVSPYINKILRISAVMPCMLNKTFSWFLKFAWMYLIFDKKSRKYCFQRFTSMSSWRSGTASEFDCLNLENFFIRTMLLQFLLARFLVPRESATLCFGAIWPTLRIDWCIRSSNTSAFCNAKWSGFCFRAKLLNLSIDSCYSFVFNLISCDFDELR